MAKILARSPSCANWFLILGRHVHESPGPGQMSKVISTAHRLHFSCGLLSAVNYVARFTGSGLGVIVTPGFASLHLGLSLSRCFAA